MITALTVFGFLFMGLGLSYGAFKLGYDKGKTRGYGVGWKYGFEDGLKECKYG